MKRFVSILAAVLLMVAISGPAFAQRVPPKGTEGPDIRKVEPKGTEGPDIRAKVAPKGTEGPDIRTQNQ